MVANLVELELGHYQCQCERNHTLGAYRKTTKIARQGLELVVFSSLAFHQHNGRMFYQDTCHNEMWLLLLHHRAGGKLWQQFIINFYYRLNRTPQFLWEPTSSFQFQSLPAPERNSKYPTQKVMAMLQQGIFNTFSKIKFGSRWKQPGSHAHSQLIGLVVIVAASP